MNRNFITVTIEQKSEEEGSNRISVCGERNGRKCFSESFESKAKPIRVHLASKEELENEDAFPILFCYLSNGTFWKILYKVRKHTEGCFDKNTENIKFSFY